MSDEPAQITAGNLLQARVTHELERSANQPLEPALYLVATPIGNLADISIRALAILSRADVIYAEDTRHSSKLMAHYGISQPMRPYHEHNAERERPKVASAIAKGQAIALISDAGTPLISDPGYKLVRDLIKENHRVISIPGASAPLAALCCSGLPTNAFMFAGFLPPKQGERRTKLEHLKTVTATLVFFEAPSRIQALIDDLSEILGPRQAVIARELTKLHEEIARGILTDLQVQFKDRTVKGECVVLVGPPQKNEATDNDIVERLTSYLEDMSLRDASRAVADDLSVAKTRVYELGLKLKDKGL